MPLPDTEREDGMNDFEGSGKTDIDRIQCCSIVNSYVMEIRNGADPDLIKKQLKEGQSLERLRGYRGIIEEKSDGFIGVINTCGNCACFSITVNRIKVCNDK